MTIVKPRLFSFRRCPYALRARMALDYARCEVEIVEVSLKAKPAELLACSPKGTVPVLRLEHAVLEQSLDIMRWALAQHDPEDWSLAGNDAAAQATAAWIAENDGAFKGHLDRYKYAVRFPEHSRDEYRARGEEFLFLQFHSLPGRVADHHRETAGPSSSGVHGVIHAGCRRENVRKL